MAVVVVAVVAAAGTLFYTANRQTAPQNEQITVVDKPETEAEEALGPEGTVELFMEQFMKSAPPAADQEAAVSAASYLTEEAKTAMSDVPTSGELARLVGVQDIPDLGYKVAGVSFKENPVSGEDDGLAEVDVTLMYSGGDRQKTFELIKDCSSWTIDAVR